MKRMLWLVGAWMAAATGTSWAQETAPSAPGRLPNVVGKAAPGAADLGDYQSPNPIGLEIVGTNDAKMGESIEYKIVIANRGATPFQRVGLKLFRSPGVTFAERAPEDGAALRLEPGQSKSVPIKARMVQSGTQGIKAEVSADGMWKRTAELVINVRRPDLTLEFTGAKLVKPEEPGDYTLVVVNTGERQAHDTTVFLELPDGWELVSSYPAAVWVPDQRYAYWILGDFAVGQRFRYQMRVKSTKPGAAELRASAKDAGTAWGETYLSAKCEPASSIPTAGGSGGR